MKRKLSILGAGLLVAVAVVALGAADEKTVEVKKGMVTVPVATMESIPIYPGVDKVTFWQIEGKTYVSYTLKEGLAAQVQRFYRTKGLAKSFRKVDGGAEDGISYTSKYRGFSISIEIMDRTRVVVELGK